MRYLVAAMLLFSVAFAYTLSDCTTINTPGYYVLTGDLNATGYSPCIAFNVSDVVIDCNGSAIFRSTKTNATFSFLQTINNITIQNCNITGANIVFQGNYYVSNLTIEDTEIANYNYLFGYDELVNYTFTNVTAGSWTPYWISNFRDIRNIIIINSTLGTFQDTYNEINNLLVRNSQLGQINLAWLINGRIYNSNFSGWQTRINDSTFYSSNLGAISSGSMNNVIMENTILTYIKIDENGVVNNVTLTNVTFTASQDTPPIFVPYVDYTTPPAYAMYPAELDITTQNCIYQSKPYVFVHDTTATISGEVYFGCYNATLTANDLNLSTFSLYCTRTKLTLESTNLSLYKGYTRGSTIQFVNSSLTLDQPYAWFYYGSMEFHNSNLTINNANAELYYRMDIDDYLLVNNSFFNVIQGKLFRDNILVPNLTVLSSQINILSYFPNISWARIQNSEINRITAKFLNNTNIKDSIVESIHSNSGFANVILSNVTFTAPSYEAPIWTDYGKYATISGVDITTINCTYKNKHYVFVSNTRLNLTDSYFGCYNSSLTLQDTLLDTLSVYCVNSNLTIRNSNITMWHGFTRGSNIRVVSSNFSLYSTGTDSGGFHYGTRWLEIFDSEVHVMGSSYLFQDIDYSYKLFIRNSTIDVASSAQIFPTNGVVYNMTILNSKIQRIDYPYYLMNVEVVNSTIGGIKAQYWGSGTSSIVNSVLFGPFTTDYSTQNLMMTDSYLYQCTFSLANPTNVSIYDNVFENCSITWNSGITWNTTKNCGVTNIVGSGCLGGNYYSQYTGNDTDGDGIGDTPYNFDQLPLKVHKIPMVGTPWYPKFNISSPLVLNYFAKYGSGDYVIEGITVRIAIPGTLERPFDSPFYLTSSSSLGAGTYSVLVNLESQNITNSTKFNFTIQDFNLDTSQNVSYVYPPYGWIMPKQPLEGSPFGFEVNVSGNVTFMLTNGTHWLCYNTTWKPCNESMPASTIAAHIKEWPYEQINWKAIIGEGGVLHWVKVIMRREI